MALIRVIYCCFFLYRCDAFCERLSRIPKSSDFRCSRCVSFLCTSAVLAGPRSEARKCRIKNAQFWQPSQASCFVRVRRPKGGFFEDHSTRKRSSLTLVCSTVPDLPTISTAKAERPNHPSCDCVMPGGSASQGEVS